MTITEKKTTVVAFLLESLIKQLRNRRQRELMSPKNEFAPFPTSSLSYHLVHFVTYWRLFEELNSQGPYPSPGKEKENRRLVFTSSIKGEIRTFHVVVVQWRQRKCRKMRDARAELLVCWLNLLFVCFKFSLPSSSSWHLKLDNNCWANPRSIFSNWTINFWKVVVTYTM